MGSNVAGIQTNQKRELPNGPPFAATAAENGLSVDLVNGRIVWGQDFGTPGDPARILTPREIPMDPATFIELRAGTLGTTGGLSLIGLTNDGGVSFQPFVMSLVQIAQLPAAVLVLAAQAVNGSGAGLQMDAEQGSGRLTANGRNAVVPAILQDAFVMNSNNNTSSIGFVTAPRNAATPGRFIYAGTDGAGTFQEYLRILPPVSAVLDFPNTLAFTSSDLTLAAPGAIDGDAVEVGAPVGSIGANSMFWGFVSAPNVVTVRFCNFSALAIDPAPGTFRVKITGILRP